MHIPFHTLLLLLLSLLVVSANKAGLGWLSGNKNDITQYQADKVTWYYTWSPKPVVGHNLEFVPMIKGSDYVREYVDLIERSLKTYNIKVLLGMNEPEVDVQANTSAEIAVALWKTHYEPLKARNKHLRLGSPAPFNSDEGKIWLQDFFRICNGSCTVDFLALHWFGTNATSFIAHLNDYHQTFNKPIWVTEWASQNCRNSSRLCSILDTLKFLNETQTFMDNADFVERYAWWGVMDRSVMRGVNQCNCMMGEEGEINELGRQYIGKSNAPSIRPPIVLLIFILSYVITPVLF